MREQYRFCRSLDKRSRKWEIRCKCVGAECFVAPVSFSSPLSAPHRRVSEEDSCQPRRRERRRPSSRWRTRRTRSRAAVCRGLTTAIPNEGLKWRTVTNTERFSLLQKFQHIFANVSKTTAQIFTFVQIESVAKFRETFWKCPQNLAYKLKTAKVRNNLTPQSEKTLLWRVCVWR